MCLCAMYNSVTLSIISISFGFLFYMVAFLLQDFISKLNFVSVLNRLPPMRQNSHISPVDFVLF